MTLPPFVIGTVVMFLPSGARASLPPRMITSCRSGSPRRNCSRYVPIPPQIRPYSGAAIAIFVCPLPPPRISIHDEPLEQVALFAALRKILVAEVFER